MTQPSPADTLRAAATRLREHATTASPGPWAVNQWGNVETSQREEMAEVWPLQAKPGANAAYIAAMHPGVGQALADWLGSWTGIDLYEAGSLPEDARHALTIARVILGDQP